ncbi:MAG TPA: GTP-binding protein, partial [Thermopetrobacter sp.]|nr:GTP-binding protein [Thermopetrobacter sp.]
MPEVPEVREPLPFDVITGFLGAGKTTLLNRLLVDPALAGTLVIINEFGEVGLDHLLCEAAPGEVIELTSGCMCCALRGDLVDVLVRVFRRHEAGEIGRLERIVVETSGLADPAPVLHTVMAHPWLLERLRLDAVVAVVDAVNGPQVLERHAEAVKQVAIADRHVITKADLLPPATRTARLEALSARLAAIQPAARRLVADDEGPEATMLFGAGLRDAGATVWLGEAALSAVHAGHAHGGAEEHRHDHGIHAFAIRHAGALTASGLEILVDLLRANFGPSLLRVKGIVRLAEDGARPVVIHGVQHIFHPPARLPAWPDEDHDTRLVFIVRGDI